MNHTPTPWKLGERSTDQYHEGWTIEGPDLCCIAIVEDAAFIVRAVNAHEDLLNLVKRLRDLTLSESGARTHMTLDVDAAIAKAEGK